MSNVVKEIDTKIGFKEASRDPQLFEKTFNNLRKNAMMVHQKVESA